MTTRALVYWLMTDKMEPLYIGITNRLRARVTGHYGKSWYGDVAVVGVRHFESRYEAEAYESVAIQRAKPKHNGLRALFCETLNTRISGKPPNRHTPIPSKDMRAPWYFAPAQGDDMFDKLFVRDRECERAGFDAVRRKPRIAPRALALEAARDD